MEENTQDWINTIQPSREEKGWLRKRYNWAGATLLMQIAIMNIVAIAVTLIVMAFRMAKSGGFGNGLIFEDVGSVTLLTMIANLGASVIGYPIVYLIGCKGLKTRLGSFFSAKGFDWQLTAFGVCFIMGVQVPSSWAASLVTELGSRMGFEFTTLDIDLKDGIAVAVLTIFLTCVTAPIFEEMIFRGLILKACSQVSARFGILMSAFLFALFHQNLPQMAFAFPLGLVLGYVAYKAGSILPTILMHFAVNFIGMVQQTLYDFHPDVYPVVGWGMTVLFLMAGVTALILYRKKLALPKTTREMKKRTAPLFWSSWAMLLAVAVCLVFTALSIEKI